MAELSTLGPVLVANRGEIAVRVCRTLRRLGLPSVAVYSDADAGAPHVGAADAAVRIGPADARASYLSIPALIEAARASDARAVHPGYGFLAESAAFAQAVLDAGLVWVGPPAEAIELMGDKARAKRLAREAGVPVVPGVEGADLTLEQIEAFVAEQGLPVVVKAVAGGGGKGMRVVREAGALAAALDAARREASAAFGDDRVLVERYLERPRHIEIQLLADAHGTVVHFGERECSLQRRHQKVVEEAPSPIVDPDWRAEMGGAATRLAEACGYVGAGTVELIVPGATDGVLTGDFFFLEMNTRLQVEHPVTELVYDVDLVEQQLRVAAGERLALEQATLVPRGHAVEARLYAEDPAAGFLPSTGVVRHWRAPVGEGVRVDGAIAEGLAVQTHYDPMLAKVIAHGPDRATALARLDRALAQTELLGVTTNAPFTRALLARDDVRSGALDTGLLERVLSASPPAGDATPALGVPADLLPAAALALALLDAEAHAQRTSIPFAWRSDGTAGTWRRRVTAGGSDAVELTVRGSEVTVAAWTWQGEARRLDATTLEVALDGVARRVAIAHDAADGRLWIGRDGYQLELIPARAGGADLSATGDSLAAPMPGTVLLVNVADGDLVAAGDVLVVLESMKMELSVTAPHAGTVDGLTVKPGDKVALRQTLLAVHADADGDTGAAADGGGKARAGSAGDGAGPATTSERSAAR
jgi:acetyl-CoA/propionyl-CoA carboxylase biotin carboxyl carrier protein